MGRWLLGGGLVFALVAVLGSFMFWVQNSGRLTELSFNLGFVELRLAEPAPVSTLLLAAFGLGLAVGALPLLVASRGTFRPTYVTFGLAAISLAVMVWSLTPQPAAATPAPSPR